MLKGKAGLGNRLLSLLGAILYADITRRTLYVDWRVPQGREGAGENLFPMLFSQPGVPENTNDLWTSDSVVPQFWRGRLDETVDRLMLPYHTEEREWETDKGLVAMCTIDPRRVDYPENVAVRWSWSRSASRGRTCDLMYPWWA